MNLVAATTYTHDAANRLTNLANTLATGTGPTYTLAYDDASRITRLTTNVGSSDFTYDNDGQLTSVTTTSGYATGSVVSENFSFSANGNRDSAGYATGSDNQMTDAPLAAGYRAEYTYDHEGNRTAYTVYDANDNIAQQTSYTWDYRNRLVAVTYDDDGLAPTVPELYRYAYNAADHTKTPRPPPLSPSAFPPANLPTPPNPPPRHGSPTTNQLHLQPLESSCSFVLICG